MGEIKNVTGVSSVDADFIVIMTYAISLKAASFALRMRYEPIGMFYSACRINPMRQEENWTNREPHFHVTWTKRSCWTLLKFCLNFRATLSLTDQWEFEWNIVYLLKVQLYQTSWIHTFIPGIYYIPGLGTETADRCIKPK